MFPPPSPRSPTIDPTAARIEREWKHPSPLVGCRFDPSGRFLFASAQDSTLQRFDLLTGAKVALAGHARGVRGIAAAPAAPKAVGEVAAWERTRDELLAAAGSG